MQSPVIVLSDLDLGMNEWMTHKFEYPDVPMDRGKILWEDDLEKMLKERNGDWGRYLDIDGDGIPYRTVLGNTHPKSAYLARGTGHDDYTRYSEDSSTWERTQTRLESKYLTAQKYVPGPIIQKEPAAAFGIVAFGSTDLAILEARDSLKNKGISTNYARIRALPFNKDVQDFIEQNSLIYVVEINRDGQMCQLLQMTYPENAGKFVKICHADGMPLTAEWICKTIQSHREK
jgi:2-oxoglutarate/2-oxoacid ferredoxin oxidoreductase subunit alpha